MEASLLAAIRRMEKTRAEEEGKEAKEMKREEEGETEERLSAQEIGGILAAFALRWNRSSLSYYKRFARRILEEYPRNQLRDSSVMEETLGKRDKREQTHRSWLSVYKKIRDFKLLP